jgi:hypothetical protein
MTFKSKHIYPQKLEKYIKKNRYIPRRIHDNEHLKLYHRYWLSEINSVVKIMEIFSVEGTEYYIYKNESGMAGCESYPASGYNYELLHNNSKIENDDIINSDKEYTGAEIKYWFVLNNIDFNDDYYSGYWNFVNPRSRNIISDSFHYNVISTKKKRAILLAR